MAEIKTQPQAEPDYVVIDSGKTTLKDLYKKEDWMAVWMGFCFSPLGCSSTCHGRRKKRRKSPNTMPR